MNVLVWHVHGSWTTAFVQGPHTYLVPVLPDRGPGGRGRAVTYRWPASVVEVTPAECLERADDVDLVVLQRPEELHHLAEVWLGGRVAGRDVPAVYVEHNAPQGRVDDLRHPAADRDDLVVVHVTHFNRLFWDTGTTPTVVVEHGIPDPGDRWTGELERVAVAVNEPVRRARVTGTDLLPTFAAAVPIDLYGIGAGAMAGTVPGLEVVDDPPQATFHDELARRRAYLHPFRWTSLGLTLLEAMHLGMPVVGLATTEAVEAVPPEAGVLSNRPDVLVAALRRLLADHDEARVRGKAAREAAVARYGLGRFLSDWEQLFEEVVR